MSLVSNAFTAISVAYATKFINTGTRMGMKYTAAVTYIAENTVRINLVEHAYRDEEFRKSGLPIPAFPPTKLTSNDVHILRCLAQFADTEGKHVFPTIDKLMRMTLLCKRSVYASLASLKEKKFVIVHTGRGKSSSQYELTFPSYCFKKPNSNFRVLPGRENSKVVRNFFDQFSDDPSFDQGVM